MCQRVKDLSDGSDPCGGRDRKTSKLQRIAFTVPSFMVMMSCGLGNPKAWVGSHGEHLCADDGVSSDNVFLCFGMLFLDQY